MGKQRRRWDSAPLTPEKTREAPAEALAEAEAAPPEVAPEIKAWGVMCTRSGNRLHWMRIGVDVAGRVHTVDDSWQPTDAKPHADVSDLGIARYTDAALQSCMLKTYGGPQ